MGRPNSQCFSPELCELLGPFFTSVSFSSHQLFTMSIDQSWHESVAWQPAICSTVASLVFELVDSSLIVGGVMSASRSRHSGKYHALVGIAGGEVVTEAGRVVGRKLGCGEGGSVGVLVGDVGNPCGVLIGTFVGEAEVEVGAFRSRM